jgi:hypothetical protein
MPLRPAVPLFLLCAALLPAGAQEPAAPPPTAIWSGLILATNDPQPAPPPPQLRRWADKLHTIFGYNQFELVGEYSQRMDDAYQRWLVPSKDFSLSVTSHTPTPAGRMPLTLTLFENHRRLAEIETRLHPGHPLFIRGPGYAGGQLVIVIRGLDASEAPVRVYHPMAVPPPGLYYGVPGGVLYPPPLRPRIHVYPTPPYYMLLRRDRFYDRGGPYQSQRPGDFLDPRFMHQ